MPTFSVEEKMPSQSKAKQSACQLTIGQLSACTNYTTPMSLPKRPQRVSSLRWRDSYLFGGSSPNSQFANSPGAHGKTTTASAKQPQVQSYFSAKENNEKFLTMRKNTGVQSTGTRGIAEAPNDLIRRIKTPTKVSSPAHSSDLSAPLEQQPKSATGVPIIVEACLQYLAKKPAACVGLFRVPGNSRHVQEMWDYLRDHPYARLSINCINVLMRERKQYSANDVASFLKRFIKSAVGNEPVVSYSCYSPLLDVITDTPPSNYIGRKCRHIVSQLLVPSRRLLLGRLCNFLRDFSQHEDTTKMNCASLATCFVNLVKSPPQDARVSPAKQRKSSIFGRKKSETPDEIHALCHAQAERMKTCVSIVQALIEHSEHIFTSCVARSTLVPHTTTIN